MYAVKKENTDAVCHFFYTAAILPTDYRDENQTLELEFESVFRLCAIEHVSVCKLLELI